MKQGCRFAITTRFGPAYCGAPSRFLIAVPGTGGEYRPHCRKHTLPVLTQATRAQHDEHEAGYREPVLVLPVDVL